MTEFKREPRYIIFKIKDLERYFSAVKREAIADFGEQIARLRRMDGKAPLNAVVVEQDWPEFEPTWAAIEARMNPTQEVGGIKSYRKKNVQPMRPYIPGEDMTGISVNKEDTPELGGMIAVNPANGEDRWYVAKKFFEENYVQA